MLTTAVAAPFGLAVSGKKVYVADGMAGTVTTTSGKTVVSKPGYDVAGVDVAARTMALAYTFTNGDHTEAGLTITARGRVDVVADIAGYEAANNPDGASTYAVLPPQVITITAAMAAGLEESFGAPTARSTSPSCTTVGSRRCAARKSARP